MTAGVTFEDATKKWEQDKEYMAEKRRNVAVYDFGLMLLRAEDKYGITREELSEKCGISVSRLTEIENADDAADLVEIQQIAMALGFNARVIFVPDDN